MAQPPRQTTQEFVREVARTGDRYVVVEGRADVGFYSLWLRRQIASVTGAHVPHIVSVDSIQVDPGLLFDLRLPDSNRSRVLALAADQTAENLWFLADRDCDHGMEVVSAQNLLWTDFPALESYALTAGVLDCVNLLFLGGRLPDGAAVVEEVVPILRQLYTIRLYNPNLPEPNLDRAFYGKDPVRFDIEKAVPPELRPEVPKYEIPAFADPRSVAYGHDVAAVLMHRFANVIGNQAKISRVDVLEKALRSCLVNDPDLHKQSMFSRLLELSTQA